MRTAPMRFQQHPNLAVWRLEPGQSLRLDIGPGERHLRVCEGRLWLTAKGRHDAPADDVWLAAGDAVSLPSGASLVAEGWPHAGFELVVPPQACAGTRARLGAWLSSRWPWGRPRPSTRWPTAAGDEFVGR